MDKGTGYDSACKAGMPDPTTVEAVRARLQACRDMHSSGHLIAYHQALIDTFDALRQRAEDAEKAVAKYNDVNNVVGCVACKQPVQVTALNAIRCEKCGSALAAEVDNLREALKDQCEEHQECRTVLAAYDQSTEHGVEPLPDVIQRAVNEKAAQVEAANTEAEDQGRKACELFDEAQRLKTELITAKAERRVAQETSEISQLRGYHDDPAPARAGGCD